jgi:hypothetical protein
MLHGNVPPVRLVCPFQLIVGLLAHWCNLAHSILITTTRL